ncbi:MAG: hypothetical protein ACXU8S_10025 [Phenylobacterium sp.]
MDRMKAAATALALAMLAGQASAQEGDIVNMWPKAGEWVTVLVKPPAGGAICSSRTGPQKTETGEEASFSVDIAEPETHFHLRLRGAAPIDPSSLKMEASGVAVVDMPVIRRLEQGGVQDIEAEIVGDRFVRLVEPRLVGKEKVVIRAGERTYVLPHENFVRTIDNLSACAVDLHGGGELPEPAKGRRVL